MNHFNEPHRINRFIELDRIASTESTEMRFKRVERQIKAAVDGVTKRNHHVRLNRTH